VLFVVLNLVGLAIAEVVVGLVTYGLGLHGQLQYNAASFVGTGFGTIFRYFAYRRWVFLAPGAEPAGAPRVPDYPPWELDPAFFASPEAAARRPAAAPVPLSPWGREPLSASPRQPASSWNQAAAASVWGAPAAAQATQRAARPAPAAPSAQRAAHPGPVGPRPSGRHRKG